VTPPLGWRTSLRLPRDDYVRLDANDYSVHPAVVGRRVEVIADLDAVSVFCAGRTAATHQRCWARHKTIIDPEHRAAADVLHQLPRPSARPVAADGRAAGTIELRPSTSASMTRRSPDGRNYQDQHLGLQRRHRVPDPRVEGTHHA
jgi:hypothetical protein